MYIYAYMYTNVKTQKYINKCIRINIYASKHTYIYANIHIDIYQKYIHIYI